MKKGSEYLRDLWGYFINKNIPPELAASIALTLLTDYYSSFDAPEIELINFLDQQSELLKEGTLTLRACKKKQAEND